MDDNVKEKSSSVTHIGIEARRDDADECDEEWRELTSFNQQRREKKDSRGGGEAQYK